MGRGEDQDSLPSVINQLPGTYQRGLIAAAWQAYSGGAGIDVSGIGYADWLMLGNTNLNGMTAALAVSAWGGVYTFLVRFIKTRNQLLG